MSYFINSLFKSKSVQKLTQVSIKISKISYFCFTFKLKLKKKAPLKNLVWIEEEVARNFLLEGCFGLS